MKKILVLLLMLTLFSAVSCDDEEGGQGGIVEPGNSFLIFHPNPDPNGALTDEREVTELEEYNKEGVRIYSKFMDALSTGNSGWAAYRWSSDHAATDADTDTTDATDCNGEYKVSYLERAVDNYFVGAGVCLVRGTNHEHDDARIENLQKLVNFAMNSGNSVNFLRDRQNNDDVNMGLMTTCDTYSTPTAIGNLVGINNESGELFLFIAELVDSTTDSTTVGSGASVGTISSVNVVCHPASSVDKDNLSTPGQEGKDIYGETDDSGRAYIKEAVDELFGEDITNSGVVDADVWSVHTAPKLNEAGNDLEPDTLNDPPKLSYFKISGNIGPNDRRFIVGGGIYLDANNENEATGNELTEIRQRVRTAVGQLREAELEEGAELSSLFEDGSDFIADDSPFILNANPLDTNNMMVEDPEAYIFVWENR